MTTRFPRSKNPSRIALMGAVLMAAATDLQAASTSCRTAEFDADKDFTGMSDVSDRACSMAAASPKLTVLQNQVDTAGAAKKVRTAEITNLGSAAKKATCIGIDGTGLPGAATTAAKKASGSCLSQ